MKISDRAKKIAKDNCFKLKKLRNFPYNPKLKLRSYLIQALEKPTSQNWSNKRGEVEFGWGGGHSGLTHSELVLLNKIFYFKYMGASEYEHGQLGKSFKNIVNNLSKFTFIKQEIEGFNFYIVCLKELEKDVMKKIKYLIVNNQFKKYRMGKVCLKLDEKLTNPSTYFLGGWDITNDFIFFISEKPFNKFKKLVNALPEVMEIKRLLKL